ARRAADLLREALGLWRGAPLADLAYEPFARPAVERLEEIRLAALEQRIEAELGLGLHSQLTAELEQLVNEHPLSERFRAQLMLALSRSGRQAEALEVYRQTREKLVQEFGIEPTAALRRLEHAILTQDRSLDLTEPAGPVAEPPRAVLVLPAEDERIDRVLTVAQQLAALPGRELIIARLVSEESALGPALAALSERRESMPK